MNYPRQKVAAAVCAKIRQQFGKSPEEKLHFAIVERAVHDYSMLLKLKEKSKETGESMATGHESEVANSQGQKARRYLGGFIRHAEICGVNSEWIRKVMNAGGLVIEEINI